MPSGPSWRSAAAYAYLDNLSPAELAWEFLRRNPRYRRDYRATAGDVDPPAAVSERVRARWGLCFPIDPDLRADEAPVVWLPELDPGAVLLASAPATFTDAQTVGTIMPSFQRSTRDFTCWIVEDGHGRLPVVRIGDVGALAPAAAVIPLDADFTTRLGASLRLRNRITGRHAHPPDRMTAQRRQRLALTLRALDGRLGHATYRAIAQNLFGRAGLPAGPAWRTHGLRDRTIRLARSGLKLMRGGYLGLLRSPQPPR